MEAQPTRSTTAARRFDGGLRASRTVMVPLIAPSTPDRVVELAVDLARVRDGEVVIVLPDAKPRQTPVERYTSEVERDHELATQVRHGKDYARSRVRVDGVFRVGSDRIDVIRRAVDEYDVETLLVGSPEPVSRRSSLGGSAVAALVDRADCDVIVGSRLPRLESMTSILVAVAGGPHSGLALDTARALCLANQAELDVFHVTGPSPSTNQDADVDDVIDAAVDQLGDFDAYDTWVYEAEDVADAIIEQSEHYSLTILGWPQKGRLERFIFGSTTDSVARSSAKSVLTVRSEAGQQTWFERWLARGT